MNKENHTCYCDELAPPEICEYCSDDGESCSFHQSLGFGFGIRTRKGRKIVLVRITWRTLATIALATAGVILAAIFFG